MTSYHAEPNTGRVRMETSTGPVWLDETMTNDLLDIYERHDAKPAFLDLYEAGQEAGFIPRGNSFRRVAA
jgi:hypothetical protein